MTRSSVLVVLLLAGCGPDFAHSYYGVGDFVTTGTCVGAGDWPPLPGSSTVWSVKQDGGVLTIATRSCGDLVAEVSGVAASLRPASCASFPTPSGTVQMRYTSGTLTYSEPRACLGRLQAELQFEASSDGGAFQTCAGTTSGALRRAYVQNEGCPIL